jgi:hypothetical protein
MPIRGSIANSLKSFGGDRVGRDIPEVKTGFIDYIMVAGGGGGGYNAGGGGGGGGVIVGSGYPVSSGITLSIGVGGGGGTASAGNPSTITGPGTPSLTAIGGDDGGDGNNPGETGPGARGGDGGSGGGGGRDQGGAYASTNPTSAGLGTPGQGNRGGYGGTPPNGAAGGGGGVGGNGSDGRGQNQYDRDDPRNGAEGRSLGDFGWPGASPWLNSFGINGGTPSGTWENYIVAAGGGNGIYRGGGPADPSGNGGSARSWTGLPNTGGKGGAAPGSPVEAQSGAQYTGSGGGGGARNPGNGVGPGGASGSGGTILIKYDTYFANASSVSGALYINESGYRIFHWLGSGSITF